ncbi:exonuclease II Exo2, partial [Coemansia sp. RSA 25]
MRDAALVGVSDASGTYTMDAAGGGVIFLEHPGAGERQAWTRRYMDAVHRAKKTQAVLTPERARVLVHVLPLRGMELLADGSLVRDYGFSSCCSPLNGPPGGEPQPWAPPALWGAAGVAAYPAGLVSTDARGAWADSPRFKELDAAPLDQALAVGSRAFFLGRSALYGAAGKVVGHAYDDAGVAVGVDLQVAAGSSSSGDRARHDNFLAVQALARADTEHYAPSYAVARTVGVSPLLLSRITSKLLLLGDDSKHVHVGLDLKSEARRLKVAGFTRRGPSGWQFSDRAVALVAQYKQAFPRMFAALERAAKAGNASAALPTAAECFRPEQPGADARAHVAAEVRRVRQWLRDNADRGALALVPIESELLSRAQIAAIVAARAANTATTNTATTATTTVRGVRREAALRPADAEHVLKAQALAVGHRVAYVADRGGSVPLGATGYVVGIHAKEDAGGGGAAPASASPAANSQYAARLRQEGVPADAIAAVEVLLDRPFADGTTLDGRCPPQRGAL